MNKETNKTKVFAVLVLMSFVLSAIPFSMAATAEANADLESSANISLDEVDASLEEDVSGFKVFMSEVGIFFTVNQEIKAKKELDLARLRLIQAKVAAKNNNTVAMEKALIAHQKIIARVESRVEAIDEGTKTEVESRASSKMFVGIERAIEVHELHVVRMRALLEDENLTIEQRTRIEASIEKTEDNIEHLKGVSERKKERLKTRLMAIVNLSEDEANEVIAEIEADHSIDALKGLKIKVREEGRTKAKAREDFDDDDEEDDDSEIEAESETEVEVESDDDVEVEVDSNVGVGTY